jgi:hypothetical protein
MAKKKVTGVDIDKVDESVLDAALKAAGFDVEGTVEEKVNKMADHQRDVTKADDLADCSTCGGESDVKLPSCPFCGDGEIIEGKAGAAKKAAEKAKAKPASKRKLVATTETVHATVVEVITPGAAMNTVAELDRAVANIALLKMAAVRNIWALGREIAIVIAGDLWKQRRDADGSLSYRTFKSFSELELGMSTTYAYKLARISETFTEQEVSAVGTKKLGIMLQLPKPMQDKLIADAMAGASSAEIQESTRPAPKPVSDKVSIISVDARVTIPLFARATKKDKLPSPAMNMRDDPWAEERFENGVVHRYTLRANAKGEWILAIERRRDTE